MNTRIAAFLYAVPVALLLASIGAFLIYVPLIEVGTVTAITLGFVLAFGLGVLAGGRRIRVSRLLRKVPEAQYRPS
jgi:hypothetical protein